MTTPKVHQSRHLKQSVHVFVCTLCVHVFVSYFNSSTKQDHSEIDLKLFDVDLKAFNTLPMASSRQRRTLMVAVVLAVLF